MGTELSVKPGKYGLSGGRVTLLLAVLSHQLLVEAQPNLTGHYSPGDADY